MNLTEKFLNNIDILSKGELPKPVLERAKLSLLDYIAVTTAGAKANYERLYKYIEDTNPEPGSNTLIGMGKRTNLKDAVFINGLNAHALDFDDGTNTGIIHLGSPIFSVLIPLAEKHNISIDKMLKAAIIGYEASFTMAVSIQPKHKSKGYHATGTCGVLGIAIAVSYMLNFSEEERKNAFSIAAVSATGMLKVVDDESELKPYNVAKSALMGLISTQMARAGFVGNNDVLAGDIGFLKMMTGSEKVDLCAPLLDGTYAIKKTYTKPYAACRYCHPAIEAAIKLGKIIEDKEVKNILVETYDLAVRGHDHTIIKGVGSAKMSIPYGVAVGILKGKAGLVEYDEEHIIDESILDLAKKTIVKANDDFSEKFPREQLALVTIELNDGTKVSEQVAFPKGEPENPLSNDEFNERFISLLKYGGSSLEEGEKIIEICNEESNYVKDLCEII